MCETSGAKCNYESLLNTAEAARFLRVSQASVRRWFDAGLLPGHRVGRRGERRFQQEDLVAFLSRGSAPSAGAATVSVAGVTSGVPLHLAVLFSTDQGGLRLTAPFLAEGVRLHQACLLVASGAPLERYASALESMDGIAVLELKGGSADAAIAQMEENFSRSVTEGSSVVRLVGEMAEVRAMFPTEDEMLRYEEALELMCRRFPVAVICQYDARRFDGSALLRALKAHPDMFGLRTGAFLL